MINIVSPTLNDISQIQSLLQPEVESGNILFRSNDEMATNIRSYLVAKYQNNIVGAVALHIYSTQLAEFRSMIVDKRYRGRGIGSMLIQEGLQNGKQLGLSRVLVLTYKKDFFQRLGFQAISKLDIPNNKIWADCIKCSHFPVCDEVALIKEI